jgi:hypothetical protein
MRDMARATPEGLKGLRDRSLLLLGFGGLPTLRTGRARCC